MLYIGLQEIDPSTGVLADCPDTGMVEARIANCGPVAARRPVNARLPKSVCGS